MLVSREIYFNLTAAPSTIIICEHVFVKLCDGVIVGSGADIKHERELRFQILTDALEEPFVTVDLTVISLLDGKHQIDESSSSDGSYCDTSET